MCDWILKNLPWCVEHIGRLPLAGQIILAFGIVAAVILGHCGLQAALNAERKPRRRTRYNWVERWQRQRECDYDWVDPAKVEAWDNDEW